MERPTDKMVNFSGPRGSLGTNWLSNEFCLNEEAKGICLRRG